MFESLQSTGRQIVRAAESPAMAPPGGIKAGDSSSLQRKLEEMNQRWVKLKSRSMEIRSAHYLLGYYILWLYYSNK